MSELADRYWDPVIGFSSENRIDKRWILRQDGDSRSHGSLRIVSHPDLKPGHLRAFSSFVTKRTPKTSEEIAQSVKDYKMEEIELEVYSVNENLTTMEFEAVDRFQVLEEKFGVKIF